LCVENNSSKVDHFVSQFTTEQKYFAFHLLSNDSSNSNKIIIYNKYLNTKVLPSQIF